MTSTMINRSLSVLATAVLGLLVMQGPASAQPISSTAAKMVRQHPVAVEVYYGVRKHEPPPVAQPESVSPGTAKVGPTGRTSSPISSALVNLIETGRGGVAEVASAAVRVLERYADRPSASPGRSEPVLLQTGYSQSVMTNPEPGRLPAYLTSDNSPSTVIAGNRAVRGGESAIVVVRSTDEPGSTNGSIPGGVWGLCGACLALAAVAAGVGIGILFRDRIHPRVVEIAVARPEPQPAAEPVSPAEPPPGGIRLLGAYDAGPLPETAERFELGQSYHEERQIQKQQESANNAAALEMLLGQNLALLAAFGTDCPDDNTSQAATVPA